MPFGELTSQKPELPKSSDEGKKILIEIMAEREKRPPAEQESYSIINELLKRAEASTIAKELKLPVSTEQGKQMLTDLMAERERLPPGERDKFSIVGELLRRAEREKSSQVPASGVRAKRPRKRTPKLEERAKQHPEYADWEAKLADLDTENIEDAMHPEHRVEMTADVVNQLLKNEAMLYWLPRTMSADAAAFPPGDHRQRAISLVDEVHQKYGEVVDVRDAESAFADAEQEIGGWFGKKGGSSGSSQQRAVQERIRDLNEENQRLRNRLKAAA